MTHNKKKQSVCESGTQVQRRFAGGGVIVSLVFWLLSGALNYFGSNPRILYLPAIGICLFDCISPISMSRPSWQSVSRQHLRSFNKHNLRSQFPAFHR